MNEANYASLSAGLLARKGQARPAMRPQGYGFASDDDLGWNDMGGDMLTAEQRVALMPAQPMHFQPRSAADIDTAVPSPVAAQQQAIAEEFAAAAAAVSTAEPADDQPEVAVVEPLPMPVAAPVAIPSITVAPAQTAHRPRAMAGSKAKAAFTLRLDPERHMKLRLACVYANQSAQQLVTAALDEYLSTHFPDALKDMRKSAAN
ncbi:hypothetical protein [Sphingosinicella soli]|uniref:Uncharacterized protein n=1 Tax=Sphingosinicella soli TaxID=333708 RepID=A0A7W7AYB2_9SPHN|nr:hypothetical protein [Sphingosinicella soli]MBB4630631.1 hypothetical protein [Sphingosinicella soli]